MDPNKNSFLAYLALWKEKKTHNMLVFSMFYSMWYSIDILCKYRLSHMVQWTRPYMFAMRPDGYEEKYNKTCQPSQIWQFDLDIFSKFKTLLICDTKLSWSFSLSRIKRQKWRRRNEQRKQISLKNISLTWCRTQIFFNPSSFHLYTSS